MARFPGDRILLRWLEFGGSPPPSPIPAAEAFATYDYECDQADKLALLITTVLRCAKNNNEKSKLKIGENLFNFLSTIPLRPLWMLTRKARIFANHLTERNGLEPGEEDAIADAYLAHRDHIKAFRQLFPVLMPNMVKWEAQSR